MKKEFGFNVQRNNIKSIVERLIKSVLAEEPNPNPAPNTDPTPNPAPSGTDPKPTYNVNFEDLISKARKEEKDKLYPQIDTLKKETVSLTEKVNNHLLTIEAKDKEIADLTAKLKQAETSSSKNDDEVVKTLKGEIKDLKKQVVDLEKAKVDVAELETKIKGEYEVKLYREQKLREAGEQIIPELVTGFSKEDIDASFEVAKNRYNDIIGKVVSTATSNIPPANTSTQKFSVKDFKPEDIANMTPQQWAEQRKKLGLR